MLKKQLTHAIKLAIRRSPLAPHLRKALRSSPYDKAVHIGLKSGWEEAANWLLSKEGQAVVNDPSFHAILIHDINTDIHTELLLTAFRKKLLLGDTDYSALSNIQMMLCALIQQCIYNEYVWFTSEQENKALTQIISSYRDELLNKKINWQQFALIAMYEPIDSLLPEDMTRQALLQKLDDAPGCLKQLVNTIVSDHEIEQELKQSIKSYGSINRSTSKMIAENYEKYPYPRWVKWDFPEKGQRIQKLKKFFATEELAFADKSFDVLVAGCGTGSKAIEYAMGYGAKARILAIDLSKTSLSYASRMASEYELDNIEFAQMDLLDLPELERQFDIVECTGVLHHLQDPCAGAAAVTSQVRKNGIVHISLYSDLARRSLAQLRNDYDLHSGMSVNEIRERRYRILQERADVIDNGMSLRWDFFDLYRCKDLLFHPLERCYTIPEIGDMLDGLNLEFRGIEDPGLIEQQYWTTPVRPEDRRNIKKWHEFETKNPDAFGNLYEIWAKKTTE